MLAEHVKTEGNNLSAKSWIRLAYMLDSLFHVQFIIVTHISVLRS